MASAAAFAAFAASDAHEALLLPARLQTPTSIVEKKWLRPSIVTIVSNNT